MGKSYGHVTIEERCEIARLQASGYSIRQIAASLDRSASTVARELKRNGSRTLGYQARYADQQAHARRWQGSRLERDRGLREQVLCRLKQGWSPEQVAGRLAMESGKRVISHESIYRFIYAQMARKKDYGVRRGRLAAERPQSLRRAGGGPVLFSITAMDRASPSGRVQMDGSFEGFEGVGGPLAVDGHAEGLLRRGRLEAASRGSGRTSPAAG